MEISYGTQQEATYVANTCGRDLVIAGMDIWTCFESLESKFFASAVARTRIQCSCVRLRTWRAMEPTPSRLPGLLWVSSRHGSISEQAGRKWCAHGDAMHSIVRVAGLPLET